ncbi:hypothetical protein ECDEC7A_3317 [Escherichia coli DEC7A]|uniref:hypothetical protein n=1 Tax=Escherichia coli TaxID=562 RepID=UPI00025145BF|nr:hypothetical protein [Escherichia coli]EHV76870.1 hypothetical protein ECDEC7A_3317 [Escherichia coli DEC7A]
METLTFNNGTVSVGDVFVSSWGYEQTNVNFYQVISVHGKKPSPSRRFALLFF